AEVCDNVDNDCNGAVDNGLTRACYSGAVGTSGVGTCRPGTQTCSAGSWGSTCPGEVVPRTELCNASDDDCDNIVDDGFCRIGGVCYNPGQANPATTCQTCGAAANVAPPSSWSNVANGTACSAPTGGICTTGVCGCPAGQSNCSGVCNTTGAVCTAGVGACFRSGTVVCSGTGTACSVSAGSPTTETCNSVDDDCNGVVDNGVATSCGAPETLGTFNPGQTGSVSGFVAAPAGSERWFLVNFPATGGTPTLTLSGPAVSSGQIRMEVRTSCTAATSCPSGSSPGTQWSFTDNVAGAGFRSRSVAWPAAVYVRLFRVAATTTCGDFTLAASR
ncbi:MAG: MopE-related protein, partial [Planctomycetota bacterium]